jgi:hypothetical protein
MEDDEADRIAPIAALVAMFLVSATIVALTFWSGDLFGPWTSVPPPAVEAVRVETLQPMLRAGGATGSAEPVSGNGRADGRAQRAARTDR